MESSVCQIQGERKLHANFTEKLKHWLAPEWMLDQKMMAFRVTMMKKMSSALLPTDCALPLPAGTFIHSFLLL